MTAFFMAWGMFCVIPCPCRRWDARLYPQMLLWLPLIGLLIGVLTALAGWGLREWLATPLLRAAILVALPWLLSGFIHLDGYLDCADAILSRRDRAERLRILKDPHSGSFAVIAMVLLALLSFAACAELELSRQQLFCLALIPAASRAWATVSLFVLRRRPGSSYAQQLGERVRPGFKVAALLILAAALALPVVLCGRSGLCVAIGVAVATLVSLAAARNLDGMSGDIAGCAIVLGESGALLALVLL